MRRANDRKPALVGEAADHQAGRYKKLYSMLLDASPSSVLLVDSQLRVVSANQNFLRKAQRSEAETIGQHLDAIFPPAIVQQMDLVGRLRTAFEQGQHTRGERLIYRAPGVATRIYYYSLIPFSWQEAVEYVMVLLEDVTEQMRLGEEVRRAERHLASVVETASDIVLSTAVDGRILTWNTAAERVTGFALSEVVARTFFDLLADRHRASARRGFEMVKRGRGFGVAEWDLMTKSGTSVPVSWAGSVMKDDWAQAIAVVAVGRDLTERRKFEAQLLQSQKLAALGVMAGGIAHEIRNPLSIASSAAQFLSEEPEDPNFCRECIGKILTGIQRASLVIENLLRFARPVGPPAMGPVDLMRVVREAAALVATEAGIQQIKMEFDVPDRPVLVKGVSGLLQQLFVNLFLNALAAMPEGGRLRASVQQLDAEVRVRVRDSGCGIPASDVEKIFDPFYTTRPVGKGTGLGLSICYSIVRQHDGSIDVDSTEDQGSTFTVKLPLYEDGSAP
ncbi:MAG: PAS domain S-box protein [Acidobacteria bacterium]|nr:PAS domain S-box protein [Acidobacteriota bacterium]